jgi:hypothetical protein
VELFAQRGVASAAEARASCCFPPRARSSRRSSCRLRRACSGGSRPCAAVPTPGCSTARCPARASAAGRSPGPSPTRCCAYGARLRAVLALRAPRTAGRAPEPARGPARAAARARAAASRRRFRTGAAVRRGRGGLFRLRAGRALRGAPAARRG